MTSTSAADEELLIAEALRAASQVYCLQEGRVALNGPARELTREMISAAYFGV